jgi:hypothetical protein
MLDFTMQLHYYYIFLTACLLWYSCGSLDFLCNISVIRVSATPDKWAGFWRIFGASSFASTQNHGLPDPVKRPFGY